MTRSECPVDEFVFVRKEGNKVWETARKTTSGPLSLEDVGVQHQKDGGFLLSQNEFVDESGETQIPSHRRKEKDSPVSQQEQTELRGLLGGRGWQCEQTGPQHSAATGLQRSRIDQGTVQDMIEANRLFQQVKKESGQAIRIFSFTTEERSAHGAMQHCKTESTEEAQNCLLFTCSSVRSLQGEESLMSVISWRSGRIDRV